MNAENSKFLQQALKLNCFPAAVAYNILEKLPDGTERQKNECYKCRNTTMFRHILQNRKKVHFKKKWLLSRICTICKHKTTRNVTKEKPKYKNRKQKRAEKAAVKKHCSSKCENEIQPLLKISNETKKKNKTPKTNKKDKTIKNVKMKKKDQKKKTAAVNKMIAMNKNKLKPKPLLQQFINSITIID